MRFHVLARWICISSVVLATAALSQARAACVPAPGAGGSTYLICVPDGAPPNVDLVVYAHGYVSPLIPAGVIPPDQLSLDGVPIPGLVNSLGYAFAASSFPKNGLAIKEGIADLKNLLAFYKAQGFTPGHVYLVGVSEGGLVATKLIEDPNSGFSGGLALCGPIGDFRLQLDHVGDFRVIFDYFFPSVLLPTPVSVPPSAIANWDSTLVPAIGTAIAANPATQQLFSVTQTPVPPGLEAQTALSVLWYNIFGTDEAITELGGQPYGNRGQLYFGSKNDLRLNLQVQRFTASPAALAQVQQFYQTTGKFSRPLVTMHTTGDPIVPYVQESIYGLKVLFGQSLRNYIHIPILRAGHCNFQASEVLFGFGLLVSKVSGKTLNNAETALPTEELREHYRRLEKGNQDHQQF